MDPKEFSEQYLRAFPEQYPTADERDWSDFLSAERCYGGNRHPERRLSHLARSQLLHLIHGLNIAEDHDPITASQFMSYVQNFKDVIHRQQMDMADFVARVNDKEKEFLAEIQSLDSRNEQKAAEIRQLQEVIHQLQEGLQNVLNELRRKEAALEELHLSTSWRMTAPMRVVVTQCRRLIQAGRVLFYFVRQNARLAGQIWHAQGARAVLIRSIRKLVRLTRGRPHEAPLAADWRLEQSVHPLSFPVHAQPRVSIIIPVHNQPLYTFSCLKSLVEHPSAADAEVIVVDDHSDDETVQMLEQITGIRTVCNVGERGFVPACNLGAAQAHGDYLVFLNNDTLVSPGWLDALLAVFTRFPDAGLVGARLIYPDGRLQAAGGVIWRDGSAAHLGWGDRANAPEYSYVRKVDYCPGACIAIPRTLFDTVGRFSEEFAPAYYEDTDLAFKVREAGREVYYQPAAIIRHVEGVSMGQNALAGFKRFQVLHRQRFQEKWRQALDNHLVNGGEPLQARDRGVWKRLLVVDKVMLTPDQDSGSLRMFRLLEELVGLGVKVVFVTLYLDDREPYRSQLQQIGVEVLYPPRESTVRGYLERCGRQFDAVMLSRADVAEMLMDAVRELAPAALRIFDTVDLHYLREERMAELQANASLARAAVARKQTELSLMRKADVTLVVSPFEQALLTRENPDLRIEVVSNIHDLHGCAAGYAEREGLLFIGGFDHPPNVDAMLYYVTEILPRIQQELGPVKTWIIGSKPPAEIRALASETVIVEGFVEDVSGHFARARLSIAPLRYGAGVKGKINMSMAYGVPVVATPLAVEGMWLTDGVDVIVGADAAAFAEGVVRLYRDPRLWAMLSENGMRNLEQYFSRRVARQTMAAILQQAPRS